MSPEELGFGDPDKLHYVPSRLHHFSRVLLGRRIGPSDVFLDLGCGKGRVVYAAARRHFKRVIGVELSHELAEIAQRNLDVNRRHLRCRDVQIIQADAATYAVPDDVTYVYLYNPFVGEVFLRALAQVVASLERRPRELLMIYANPVMHEAVVRSGAFRQVRRHRHRHGPDQDVVVYKSIV